ncbi:AMP-binding protein [Ornithinimicrobium sp. F0845]|uniref:class I adenylate-forming enzyme family protein n=1 Tax=Ornithinimicrobium sp. F0845 TaxID=2926412 RepID=UPI001FF3E168|nr:AMP-binding protein [Ornithinimicrobium sp. F0845]MCK0111825.1 AMP-binding protein [Ornithinimicrobium sp. F0845]
MTPHQTTTHGAPGPHTLGRWPADRARLRPGRAAIVDRGVELTYRDLDERSRALAQAWRRAGYRRGDRVATLVGNSAEHVIAFFSCAREGLVLVPLSWRLTATELADQLTQADPAVLLIEDETETLARGALSRTAAPVPTAYVGQVGVEAPAPTPWHSGHDPAQYAEGRLPAAAAGRAGLPLGEAGPVQDDDPLLMVFTSGSSARPKAAVLTHASCFWTNLSLSRTLELDETDVVLSVLPQFHVGGWNIQPLLAWWMGATVVLERSFDPGRALCLIAEHKVSTMMGVPTHYARLAEHPHFARTDLSSLRSAVVGGAPMPAPLLRIFHEHGVALTQGYGLTEAGPNVLCVPPREAMERLGWAGVPYPHVEVQLADPATGEHLDGPATGELLVRGPGMFAGYFRDEAATRAIWRDGWLATGDVATRDEAGYLRIVDRLRNIFITGGENVAPAEVEAALRTHPAVEDVVVVGVPDERWGERGVALVVRRPGVVTDAAELTEHCRERLAAFKVPTAVHFVSQLPYAALGKVARQEALERALRAEETVTTDGPGAADHGAHTTYGGRS